MSMAVIFNFAINGYTNCLISFGRDKVMILVVVASTIVSVGGGLILIPAIGIYGAAITVALIDMAGWLISLPYYKKEVGSFQFIAWVQPMKAALISGIIALLLQQISVPFLLRVLCVCCAYLFFIRQDIRNLMRKV
jgi:O-antigen/teichoic acid export membrane protein